MNFGTYAGRAVRTAVDLVNSPDLAGTSPRQDAGDAVAALLLRRGWVLHGPLGEARLARFCTLRGRLRYPFDGPSVPEIVAHLNAILATHRALPQLTNHDGAWHWHYLPSGTELVDRVATTCAAALLGVVAAGGGDRLRTCVADGCDNAFVDASRNGSRRFCDNRTCGNRTHAAAYRARRRDTPPGEDD